MVVDALSKKSACLFTHIMISEYRVIKAAQQIQLHDLKRVTCLAHLAIQSQLIQRIKEVQLTDPILAAIRNDTEQGLSPKF